MGSRSKLTIFFENPFWVAIAEEEDSCGYRAARHVFGPEPTQPQVEDLVLFHWDDLRFTQDVRRSSASTSERGASASTPAHNIGYKRAQRIAKKAMKSQNACGTKAQQALQAQREANKEEAADRRHVRKEQEKDARFAQKQEKRRQKARGH